MNKKDDIPGAEDKKKTYTVRDLMDAAEGILKSDDIGKKLPASAIAKLSKLLVKTALKGDL